MFVRRITALVVTAVAAAAFAAAPSHASGYFGDPCNFADSPMMDGTTAVFGSAKITCLINKERAKYGKAPLAHDSTLLTVAMRHSSDTVKNHLNPGYVDAKGIKCVDGVDYDPSNYWWGCAHDGSNGSWPENRVWNSGFCTGCPVRENMYWGTGLTPTGVVAGWMASPGHKDAILDPQVTRIATGWAVGTWNSGSGATITTVFAKK